MTCQCLTHNGQGVSLVIWAGMGVRDIIGSLGKMNLENIKHEIYKHTTWCQIFMLMMTGAHDIMFFYITCTAVLISSSAISCRREMFRMTGKICTEI